MEDLKKAVEIFEESGSSLVAVNKNRVWSSSGRGIQPLYEFITLEPPMAMNASIADKVIGKAAALLAVYGGIKAIHAELSTFTAQQICIEHQIVFKAKKLVVAIGNRDKTGLCPMEKLSENVIEPQEMVEKVAIFLENLH